MSLTATLEYAEKIDEEIRHRKKRNPLEWHDLLPMQKKFARDRAKTKGLFGGNRSGKTEGVANYVLEKARRNPKSKGWVVGETFQDSVAIQQTKIWNLLPKNEVKYGRFDEINGFTNRKLQLKNGSLITFKSYDQGWEAFQSDDIDWIWNDEEPPYNIYKEQRMRLLDRDGEMIISMTSLKGVTDLIQGIYEDAEIVESQYAPLVDKELPRIAEKDGIKLFFLWTSENPHINQKRLYQETKMMDKNEILARAYGIPINMSGKIYPMMSKSVHVIPFADMPEGDYVLYHVLDPHDRKPWAIVWFAVHRTGSIYAVDEYPNNDFIEMKYDDKTYAEYAKVIKQKEVKLKEIFGVKSIRRRIIDPNFGNKTVQMAKRQGGQAKTTPKKQLARLGLKYRDGIDSIQAGHLKVRELLHYQRDKETDEIVVQPKLMFTEDCPNTSRGMLRYSWKDITTASGDEKDKVAPMDKYKDYPDCVRYGAMSDMIYDEDVKDPEGKKVY